jgi:hypothetical protein
MAERGITLNRVKPGSFKLEKADVYFSIDLTTRHNKQIIFIYVINFMQICCEQVTTCPK